MKSHSEATSIGRGRSRWVLPPGLTSGLLAAVALVAVTASSLAAAKATRPDLSTNKVSGPPDVSGPGHTFSAVARTFNMGSRIGRFRMGRVGSHRTINLFVQLLVPADWPQATYALTACADGDKKVVEHRERNNCSTSPFFMYVTSGIPFAPDA
jgi:hypothetical protein